MCTGIRDELRIHSLCLLCHPRAAPKREDSEEEALTRTQNYMYFTFGSTHGIRNWWQSAAYSAQCDSGERSNANWFLSPDEQLSDTYWLRQDF